MAEKASRRTVLRRAGVAGGLGVLALVGLACGEDKHHALSCSDTSALTSEGLQLRAMLAYTDVSPDPRKSCAQCQQFVPSPGTGVCGTCKVLKGPISPNGGCRAFVAKTAVG
jgi:hypothetical protein